MTKSVSPKILTINGGSSSIKFALFEINQSIKWIVKGKFERIGSPESALSIEGLSQDDHLNKAVTVPDQKSALDILIKLARKHEEFNGLAAIGHRIVHGGPRYYKPQLIDQEMMRELHKLTMLDPEHLPNELVLIEACQKQFSNMPHVACFDTAFHHDMPRVAKLLPIPRHYEAKGLQRYGFHGLSYQFLMEELQRFDGEIAIKGAIILAHLGNGASLAAVQDGKPIDTSMSFTPTGGLPMSTRSGDIDPGVILYLARTEGLNTEQLNTLFNSKSGLLGVSETSSDIRDLLDREKTDTRAAEAVALFCYQVKKWIGAFAAALGGVDAIVFAGGIGENAPVIRERICAGLEFLGIQLDSESNLGNMSLISAKNSRVKVRVLQTNEELMIARSVTKVLGLGDVKHVS